MAFEIYDRRYYSKRADYPWVSLSKKGELYVSAHTIRFFDLQEMEYAELYFDKEENKVGLKFSKNRSEKARKLSRQNGYILHASGLVITYNVKVPQLTLKLEREKLGDETIYTFKVELNPARAAL